MVRVKPYWLVLLCICGLLFIFYSIRNPLLRLLINQQTEKFDRRFRVSTSYSNAYLIGLNKVVVEDINITRGKNNLTLNSNKIQVYIPLSKLIRKKLSPSLILVDSLTINYNLSKEKVQIENSTSSVGNKKDISKNLTLYNYEFFRKAIGVTPYLSSTKLCVNYLKATVSNEENYTTITSESLQVNNGMAQVELKVDENGQTNIIQFASTTYSNNSIQISVSGCKNASVILPGKWIHGFQSSFDLLELMLFSVSNPSNETSLKGSISLNGSKFFHHRLSESEVSIDSVTFNFSTRINPMDFKIDSVSFVKVNYFIIPFEFSISNNRKPRVKLNLLKTSFDASDLFESIPRGLFANLQGLKVQGTCWLETFIDIDTNEPDSLIFNSKLTPIDFRILSYGYQDFRMLNDTFTYYVYASDTVAKAIRIDTESKTFCSFYKISPFLINAVVTAEDGGFFFHKGFDPDGFRYALSQNIKQNRLIRGGSTISMQLIKNLYLNRNKTLLRKAEEALIVWLIETQRLVSKERLLEIYLNIIDWGPNINGITEASMFYFSKEPSQLNLNEAIFMASIIPRPSFFMQNFDTLGNLKPYMENYFNFVAGKMYERNSISQEDLDELKCNVILSGRAKDYLNNKVETDTTSANYWMLED